MKMILKAQEVYFELHTSAVHRYEVVTTNDGQASSAAKVRVPRHPTLGVPSCYPWFVMSSSYLVTAEVWCSKYTSWAFRIIFTCFIWFG